MILTRDKRFYKNLISLSIPIALQNLVTFLVTLADNLMIGSLGDAAISGVYMGGQIQLLLQFFTVGIDSAVLVLAAQYWGKRDTEAIRRALSIGLRFSLLFGALVTLLCATSPSLVISFFTKDGAIISEGADYLRILAFSFPFFCLTQSLIAGMRSVERAKIGFGVSLASLITNVFFNFILIFGKLGFPALGVRGAAFATLISRVTEAVIMVVYVLFIDKRLKFRLRELLHTDKALLRDFLRYGAPIVAGQLVWAVNNLVGSAIMGRQTGEGVVAALSIANTLHSLGYVVMNGMSGAVGIITGKTVGAGETEKMKEYAKTVQVLFLGLGLLTGLAVFLLKNPFISLYSVTDAARSVAKQLITVAAVTLVGTCYQAACLFGLVKSGGDISFVFKNDLIFVLLIALPAGIAATAAHAPAWVVFACLKADQLLKCPVAYLKIRRYDWMKNLTREDQSQ